MKGKYLGRVPVRSDLYEFLAMLSSDYSGVILPDPTFRVFRLSSNSEVYGYEERSTLTRIVCKFYWPRLDWNTDRAARAAFREYENLRILRGYRLVGSPHHVICPLGLDRDINCVLALEYYGGEQLSCAIERATRNYHDNGHLFWRLKALAYFLATQHDRTANGLGVDFESVNRYFDHLVCTLRVRQRIGQRDVEEFSWLRDLWTDRPRMWEDQQVWLHGDATPANFLFGRGMDVAAIDLEHGKPGDRMFDVGLIAGELQHAFLMATGHRRRAEPFIGHFLWEYSCHFPDRGSMFKSVTAKAPYYMSLALLRIARNDYITKEYAGRLIRQAKRLLRAP